MADFVMKFLVVDLDIIDDSKRVEAKVKVAQLCLTICDTMDYTVHGILQALAWVAIGVGSHSLFQGIFPTQGSNPGLLHCR